MVKSTLTYEPDFVTPPGDTIAELLNERGMTQSELAQRMGRPIKTINEIIHGKKALIAETALQLERVLSVPASFWLNRERIYQEYLARAVANKALTAQQKWLDHFPIKDMQAKGWLPKYSDRSKLLMALLQFFGLAAPERWGDIWAANLVNYRKSDAYESSKYALSAWLREGEIQAQDIYCDSYNEAAFRQLLREDIRLLTCETPEKFAPTLINLCAAVGVAVAFIPQIKGARVSGATRWLSKDKALIQISLRYRTNDHFWFTFFHEAGHIVQHGKRDLFIDMENGNLNRKEQEANQFAANMLVAPKSYATFVQETQRFSKVTVCQFAAEVGVAPGIIVGRLQHDKHLPFTHLNGLKEKFIWK